MEKRSRRIQWPVWAAAVAGTGCSSQFSGSAPLKCLSLENKASSNCLGREGHTVACSETKRASCSPTPPPLPGIYHAGNPKAASGVRASYAPTEAHWFSSISHPALSTLQCRQIVLASEDSTELSGTRSEPFPLWPLWPGISYFICLVLTCEMGKTTLLSEDACMD